MSQKKEKKVDEKPEVVEKTPEVVEATEEPKKVDELVGKHIGGKEIISVKVQGDKKIVTDEAGCTYPLSPTDVKDYIK